MDKFGLGFLCGQITTIVIFIITFMYRIYKDKRKEK